MEDTENFKKNVSLVYDEMKITSKLVYSKGTGRLRGFLEGGSINDELEHFQRKISEGETPGPLATYAIVFMVRGLFSNIAYPFGYIGVEEFTSAQQYTLWFGQ